MKRTALLLTLPLLLTACPPPPDTGDGGTDAGAQAPGASSITPTTGPVSGGTDVAVFGSNFEDGVKVFFGANEGVAVTRVTKGRITTKTPAATAAGAVDVKVVNADGQQAVLPGAFTYENVQPSTINNAVLENPAEATLTTANPTAQLAVNAFVNVTGVTEGVGAGTGVLAQVGHAPDGTDPSNQTAFTWIDAAYAADVGGELENDRYSADVTVDAPAGVTPVVYALAARFSVDNGQSWVVADRDGSSNGAQAAQLSKVTVGKPKPNWCKLGGTTFGPETTSLRTNQPNGTFYAQVYQQGVTEGVGAGPGITAQFGYGAAGTLIDASGNVQDSAFTWVNATFNVDQGNNDEYLATVPTPAIGTYKYAYRVSLNGGPYLYCDATGPDDGIAEADLGTLTVAQVQIDSCALQFPPSMVIPTGAVTYDIFGRVRAAGVTDVGDAPVNLTAELGYGLATTPEANWTWSAATFNLDVNGTDEFRGSFTAPAPGSYRYAYRFRYGTSGPYTYCDLDGSTTGGFTVAQAGRLAVPTFTDCKLNAVTTTTVSSGSPLQLSAQVFGQGVTTTPGANSGIRAQLGLGDPSTNASVSNLWGWADAPFSADVMMGAQTGWDEYTVTAHPAYSGLRGIAARFSSDNGANWLYCDLNTFGSGGFEQAQQQNITVNSTAGLNFCNTQSPMTVTAGMATTVFGQVYEPGVTEPAGAAPGMTAALGYGPSVEDPGNSSQWVWLPGVFNAGYVGNNDEFMADLPATVLEGMSYAWRYSLNGGPFCFGDTDGNGTSGSFSGERQDGSSNLGRVVP